MASDSTVALHIITRHNSERLQSLLPTTLHSVVEETEGSDGEILGVEIVLDKRVLDLQLMCVLVVEVAALSDGQRDNMGIGVCHLSNNSFTVIRSKQV